MLLDSESRFPLQLILRGILIAYQLAEERVMLGSVDQGVGGGAVPWGCAMGGISCGRCGFGDGDGDG